MGKEAKRKAIIFDIDGTLAHMTGRISRHGKRAAPFVDDDAHDDDVDVEVLEMLNLLQSKYAIIICSGRKDTSRKTLEGWLKTNNIYYDEIFMRDSTRKNENGGLVSDTIIKYEIYTQLIEPKYDVFAVFDDRDQVVDMWRNKLGLKVFQVAEGAF